MTDPGRAARAGLDLARDALAAARAEARKRGLGRSGAPDRRTPGENASNGRDRRARRSATVQLSGAHPDDRDPQLLAGSLDRLTAERGWETDLAVGAVMGRWGAIVGPDLAAHCTPLTYDDGELVLQAVSTAWATQLRLLSPRLIGRLNEELGSGAVRRVRVLGPSGPSWKRGPLSVRGPGPRDTYG